MYLHEIINRPQNEEISQEESLFIIKEYVRIRKGVEITPVIQTRAIPRIFIQDQLTKMIAMRDHAIKWFKNN